MVGRNNTLSNYHFDNTKDISKDLKKNSGNGRNGREKGNKKKKEDEAVPLTFAQIKKAYYVCRDPKHLANKCPKRSKIDQKDWIINKLQYAQVSDKEKVTEKSKKGKATFADTHATVKKSF